MSYLELALRVTREWLNPAPVGEVPRVQVRCWHCGGSGRCDCISCGVMKPSVSWAAGECAACNSRKARVQ
jgi:hypothetical protein